MSTRRERAEHKRLTESPGPVSACSYGVHDFKPASVPARQDGTHFHACTECGAMYQERDAGCPCGINGPPEPLGVWTAEQVAEINARAKAQAERLAPFID